MGKEQGHFGGYLCGSCKDESSEKQLWAALISETIDYCMANDVMKAVLQEKQKEVYGMVSAERNMEKAKEVCLENGIEKIRKIGQANGLLQAEF